MKNFYSRSLTVIVFLILLAALVFLSMSQAKAATSSFYKSAFQQEVTGEVTGPKGNPLMGVTVLVKNKQYGTTTNKEGIYRLQVTARDTLVFTSIGFKKLEVPLQGRSNFDIQLEEDIASLGEVEINAGYYRVSGRERTGNISRVTAKEIENQPVVSPLQALQGRMAGVEITPVSGVSGGAPIIRIRGQNSLRTGNGNNGNLPLYIIDGVPVNSTEIQSIGSLTSLSGGDPLSSLNTSNIKSIEILKDADATAIYGSRGANGVVLITTKTGENSSGFEVDGQIYSGVAEVGKFMDLMNTSQYLKMRREAFENDAATPTENNGYDLLLWDQNRYTDWQKEIFGHTSYLTDANLNLRGGNSLTTFRIGGAFHKEGTVFPGDFGYSKVTVNSTLNHHSEDNKLALQFTLNYGKEKRNYFDGNLIPYAFSLPPNAPSIYNQDGSLNWENGSWNNPFVVLLRPNDATTGSLFSNFNISYEIIKGLQLKGNFGYSHLSGEEVNKYPLESYDPEFQYRIDQSSGHHLNERESWIAEPQLVYNTSFGEHELNIIGGLTFQHSEDQVISIRGEGYSDKSLIGNLAAAKRVMVYSDRDIIYKYAALFGRIGYNWKNRYYLNFTGRRDGSSRFGPDRRMANFGAVGAAWIFSEEKFINNVFPFLSFGKLRGSYGTTGNDQIPDYGYLDTYEPTYGPGGLYPTQLTNPDYSWEINRKLEIGTELAFFKDRIQLGASWYRNRSTNQLVGYSLPSITGFSTVQANLPATVQNTGWEFNLNSELLRNKNFTWNSNFNFTIPKNKLVAFDGIEETSYSTVYKVGYPLDIKMVYNYTGIDPETGLYTFEDANSDNSYNQEDRIIIEDLGRRWYGGFQNSFRFHNFSFQFLWEFIKQRGPGYISLVGTQPGQIGNKPVEFLNSWTNEGDQTIIQKNSQGIDALISYYRALGSNLVIEDNSFARLKDVNLSYRLPDSFLKSLKIENINLFIHGQNLWTITNYQGLDPQTGNRLPALRTITGGIQFNF